MDGLKLPSLKLLCSIRRRRRYTQVVESKIFDPDWYLLTYPDVAAAGCDPLEHYILHGAVEMRRPGPLFDAQRYVAQNADDPAAARNPLLHFIASGGTREQLLMEAREAIAASGLFDPDWYLLTYPDVAAAGCDPLEHYVLHGAMELRHPGPLFDAQRYVAQNADNPAVAHSPLLHLIASGGTRAQIAGARHAKKLALDVLEKVKDLDADLSALSRAVSDDNLLYDDGFRQDKAATAWSALFVSIDRPYERIVFVPRLKNIGPDRAGFHAAKAVFEKHGANSILLVVTDSDRFEANHWLPKGMQVRVLSDFGHDLTPMDRIDLTSWLIQALRPKCILNANSRACWEAVTLYGAAFVSFTDLYSTMPFREYDSYGNELSYWKSSFRIILRHLRGIYFDNRAFADELTIQYGLTPTMTERLKLVYLPAENLGPSALTRKVFSSPLPVLCVANLFRRKNVDLLMAIAQRDTAFHYDVFGIEDAEEAGNFAEKAKSISNLTWHGAYSSIAALPIHVSGALLHTPLWDGLPDVLLTAAAVGIPIVASDLGGINELIDNSTGWLINDVDNPAAYIAALKMIAIDPGEAHRRSQALSSRIMFRHSWEKYMQAISKSPSFLD